MYSLIISLSNKIILLYYVCFFATESIKKQTKFKNVSQNESDVMKYVLAQAPFNIKRQHEKINKIQL